MNMPLDLFLSTCLVAPVTGSSFLRQPTLLDKVTLFFYPRERVGNLFLAGIAISTKLFVLLHDAGFIPLSVSLFIQPSSTIRHVPAIF